MTTKAIEAGARAIRRVRLLLAGGIGSDVPSDSSYASAAIEAAIASGELVPATHPIKAGELQLVIERALLDDEYFGNRAADGDLLEAQARGSAVLIAEAIGELVPASGECAHANKFTRTKAGNDLTPETYCPDCAKETN